MLDEISQTVKFTIRVGLYGRVCVGLYYKLSYRTVGHRASPSVYVNCSAYHFLNFYNRMKYMILFVGDPASIYNDTDIDNGTTMIISVRKSEVSRDNTYLLINYWV